MSDPTSTLQTLVAALGTVFDKVYAQIAPDQTDAPFCVYSRVSTIPGNVLDDSIPVRNMRFQVDVYAKTYADAVSLSGQAEAAMLAVALPISVIPISQADQFEADVRLHRVINEFSVWHY